MTHMPIDDNTYSVEIGIDAEEEELGVIGGRVVMWQRITIYIYECANGQYISGTHIMNAKHDPSNPPDRDLSKARARRKALDHLMKIRNANPRPHPTVLRIQPKQTEHIPHDDQDHHRPRQLEGPAGRAGQGTA